jgi:hypothetical protein
MRIEKKRAPPGKPGEASHCGTVSAVLPKRQQAIKPMQPVGNVSEVRLFEDAGISPRAPVFHPAM